MTLTILEALNLPPLQEMQLIPGMIDGKVYSVRPDGTQSDVSFYVGQYLQVFNVINQLDPDTAENEILSTDLNLTYEQWMMNSIAGLIEIAKVGTPIDNDPTVRGVITIEMARTLDRLFKTLRAAGIDPEGTITAQDVANWKNLTATSPVVAEVFAAFNTAATESNKSFQALTELVYVQTGNEIMDEALVDLEGALLQTKKALESLNSLQLLHNNITAESRVSFNDAFKAVSGLTLSAGEGPYDGDFRKALNQFSDDFFGTEIVPVVKTALTPENTQGFLDAKEQLIETITALRIAQNLASGVPFSANTLGQRLETVLAGINAALANTTTPKSALAIWIIDNHETASTRLQSVFRDATICAFSTSVNNLGSTVFINFQSVPARWSTSNVPVVKLTIGSGESITIFRPGQIQKEITEAITAGESLNDRQKEEVRRFLFVFEEYYKSAAAILSKITQIIEKMAQGIAR